ncbi:MAG: hypothetical protein R2707_13235 [Acidimicrobiales bacterium]
MVDRRGDTHISGDEEWADWNRDSDGDGLSDAAERRIGTNLHNADTDGDGLLDGEEVSEKQFYSEGIVIGSGDSLDVRLDTESDPFSGDGDGDGLSDAIERATGSDALNYDTDGDGLDDRAELRAGTNANNADSDGDGLTDGVEVHDIGSNPLSGDSDGDGLGDLREVYGTGTSATSADSDGDGLNDADEIARGTDAMQADSDRDGLSDGYEVGHGFNPLTGDSDGDGTGDYLEDASSFENSGSMTRIGSDLGRFGGVPTVLTSSAAASLSTSVADAGSPITSFGPGASRLQTGGVAQPDTAAIQPIDAAARGEVLDVDGDGVADGWVDPDAGVADLDGDGHIDAWQDGERVLIDSDGDGQPDMAHRLVDTDGDGEPDTLEVDTDLDGIADEITPVIVHDAPQPAEMVDDPDGEANEGGNVEPMMEVGDVLDDGLALHALDGGNELWILKHQHEVEARGRAHAVLDNTLSGVTDGLEAISENLPAGGRPRPSNFDAGTGPDRLGASSASPPTSFSPETSVQAPGATTGWSSPTRAIDDVPVEAEDAAEPDPVDPVGLDVAPAGAGSDGDRAGDGGVEPAAPVLQPPPGLGTIRRNGLERPSFIDNIEPVEGGGRTFVARSGIEHAINMDLSDSDGDGLSDSAERGLGTDALRPDTDGDGLTDLYEVQHGLDPLDTHTGGTHDAITDLGRITGAGGFGGGHALRPAGFGLGEPAAAPDEVHDQQGKVVIDPDIDEAAELGGAAEAPQPVAEQPEADEVVDEEAAGADLLDAEAAIVEEAINGDQGLDDIEVDVFDDAIGDEAPMGDAVGEIEPDDEAQDGAVEADDAAQPLHDEAADAAGGELLDADVVGEAEVEPELEAEEFAVELIDEQFEFGEALPADEPFDPEGHFDLGEFVDE